MQHVSDDTVEALVSPLEAQAVLREAFVQLGQGDAALQERVRTEAGAVKLSTLGAVIPRQGVAGAKVYTTIGGRFSFVIVLFDAASGAPLATFDAAAITKLRTAACSVIAASHLADPHAATLAVFGLGVQGRAHARQFAGAYALRQVRIVGPRLGEDDARRLEAELGVAVRCCSARAAIDGADIVVTATRSSEPLFDGRQLAGGCFVAAVGSSLPSTRELDDHALARAGCIVVECKPQSLREAGDLVRADPAVLPPGRLIELADLVTGRVPWRPAGDAIAIYKSVGVGLQDVALAGLVWRKLGE